MLSNSDYTSATVCFNKTYLAFRFSLMNYLYRYDLHVLPYRLLISLSPDYSAVVSFSAEMFEFNMFTLQKTRNAPQLLFAWI